MPTIGYLGVSLGGANKFFLEGLSESGLIDGRTVAIEYRFSGTHYDRLPALAAELAARKVDVIVALFPPAASAAKAATATIPIVFLLGSDPVEQGLVASFARPGGNITGVTLFNAELGAKRLGLLHELAPKASVVGLLVNPVNASAEQQAKDAQDAAHAAGLRLIVLKASMETELDAAFASLGGQGVNALAVAADPFFPGRRKQIVALAAKYRVPAIYTVRSYTEAGGLISYGNFIPDAWHQLGTYTAKVLRGAKPAELPVMRATRFELAINLKTAQALGLTIPQTILARADKVID
jgi:ABC-type uncharacterized transport system substrate-binding protein